MGHRLPATFGSVRITDIKNSARIPFHAQRLARHPKTHPSAAATPGI